MIYRNRRTGETYVDNEAQAAAARGMLAALKAAYHEVTTDVDGISRDEALTCIKTVALDLAAAIAAAEAAGIGEG